MNNDGGPAFPYTPFGADVAAGQGTSGMTLRDWFAGQAMAALLNTEWYRDDSRTCKQMGPPLAADAYELADSMLAAREAAK